MFEKLTFEAAYVSISGVKLWLLDCMTNKKGELCFLYKLSQSFSLFKRYLSNNK